MVKSPVGNAEVGCYSAVQPKSRISHLLGGPDMGTGSVRDFGLVDTFYNVGLQKSDHLGMLKRKLPEEIRWGRRIRDQPNVIQSKRGCQGGFQ